MNATRNGHEGRVPGLPGVGGFILVIEDAPTARRCITLNMTEEQQFSPTQGLEIKGQCIASEVYFVAIIPMAVLEEVTMPMTKGEFRYKFDPKRLSDKIGNHDIINRLNGKLMTGRIVRLEFFSKEQGSNGPYHSFARVIPEERL